MTRSGRIACLCFALIIGTAVMPPRSEAAQQLACTTTVSSRQCGSEVRVGDAEKPCIERDGKAYCPVFLTFYPALVA